MKISKNIIMCALSVAIILVPLSSAFAIATDATTTKTTVTQKAKATKNSKGINKKKVANTAKIVKKAKVTKKKTSKSNTNK